MIALATGTGTASADGGKVTETYNISIVHTPDSPNTGGASGTPTPIATPTGPKTTDTSALPPELAQIPAPPSFAVVDVTAAGQHVTMTFGNYQFRSLDPSLFEAPSDYTMMRIRSGTPGASSSPTPTSAR